MLTATNKSLVDIDKDYYDEDRFKYTNEFDRRADDYYKQNYKPFYQKSMQTRGNGYDYEEEKFDSRYRPNQEARESKVNFRSRTNEKSTTRKVFKKKMIPFAVCYFLMVAVIVALLIVNVTGTAWESKTISINTQTNIAHPETANAVSNNTSSASINQITTQNGVISISTSPYPSKETYEKDTNWFDRFCDWISNLTGG